MHVYTLYSVYAQIHSFFLYLRILMEIQQLIRILRHFSHSSNRSCKLSLSSGHACLSGSTIEKRGRRYRRPLIIFYSVAIENVSLNKTSYSIDRSVVCITGNCDTCDLVTCMYNLSTTHVDSYMSAVADQISWLCLSIRYCISYTVL